MKCLKQKFIHRWKYCYHLLTPSCHSNLYDGISSVEHKRRYFEKCQCVFQFFYGQTIETNGKFYKFGSVTNILQNIF